ncbi:MAG: hypothetical protein V3V56_06385, partial [bacterium]
MKRNFKVLAGGRGFTRPAVAAMFLISTIVAPLSGVTPDAAAHGKKKSSSKKMSNTVQGQTKKDKDSHKEKGESRD